MTDLLDEDLWYGASDPREALAEEDAAKSVAAQVGRILGAKPFPIAATKLAELTRDTKTPLHKVVDVLENDPALSARLLRLVNSAGFALRTACTSVGHAAALVGTEKLNQVATTAAILDMYDSATPAAAQILEHATIVGALCRYLAVYLGLPPDELFTCGFLHDIGKLMLLDCEGDRYLQVLARVGHEPDVIHVKERELFGYDHAILAGHVLAAWHIPEPVPQVVAWHHQAARAYEDPLVARMVAVVRFCDAVSYCIFRPLPEPEIERLARMEACSYLEVSALQIGEMWADLHTLALKSRAGFRGEAVPAEVEARSRSVKLANDPEPPANDNQVPAAADPAKAPAHFPCVVCGVPSYANQCPACHGYVCPGHQLGQDEWCYLCVDEFRRLELKFPRWVHLAMASVIALTAVVSIIGASTAAAATTMKWLTAPGLGVACLAMLLFVWRRWLRRFWFVRTVANRAGFAPVVTDQVVQGITSLPPSSKRVINPFDMRSLRPVAAVGLSTGVEYYSLPPSASREPLSLSDADTLGETMDLETSDELVDMELDEPLMALAPPPLSDSQKPAVRASGHAEAAKPVHDPFAPEPASTPPLDPFADNVDATSDSDALDDNDSETFAGDAEDEADQTDAEGDPGVWSDDAAEDEPADEAWSAGPTEDSPEDDDAVFAADPFQSNDEPEDDDAAFAADPFQSNDEPEDDDAWTADVEQAGPSTDPLEGDDQSEDDDAAFAADPFQSNDEPDDDDWTASDQSGEEEVASLTSSDESESPSEAGSPDIDAEADEESAWAADAPAEPTSADTEDAASVDTEDAASVDTEDAASVDTEDAASVDTEERAVDDAEETALDDATRAPPESVSVMDGLAAEVPLSRAPAMAESTAVSPLPPSAEQRQEDPTSEPSDLRAEPTPMSVSPAEEPAPPSDEIAPSAPESAAPVASYTFRHPQAWRAIVESPGAADGW